MEGSGVRGRTLYGVAAAALGALCACGSSPGSYVDGAGSSRASSATATSAPESAAVCVQGTLRSCTAQLPAQGTVHQCFSGKQLCSAGAWGDCQDPTVLFGARSEAFAASCPAGASPRWTTLDYVVDVPANASGGADVAIAVAGNPQLVLFTAGPTDHPSAAGSVDLGPVLGALGTEANLTLQLVTTTTPDGAMAATARATAVYACDPGPSP
jgi:hypothetical protein